MLEAPAQTKSKLPLAVGAGIVALTLAFVAYLQFAPRPEAEEIALTPEAEQYAQKLNLANIEMKASLNYFSQKVVELDGTIENTGDRPVDLVEIYCLFRDYSGFEVMRSRVAIVDHRMGGLQPGETKEFRLPFDEVPENWNQARPEIFIAGIEFADEGE